ncbi:MAG TPA: PQQ-binding-like beta-propeller repeat protein [Gemmataceae bacterium]|nr:PQQ-binding-like beta-propeller repeat protein [Gemmataceae bacterium]
MAKVRTAALAAVATVLALVGAAPAWATEQQAYTVALDYATPVITAAPGDTLRLNNIDPIASHNIVSDTPGLFASPLVADGNSAVVAGVDKLAPGTYQFHCVLHSWMHGVLEVAAAAPGGPPSPPPPPDPNNPPDPVDLLPHAAPAPLSGGDWPLYGHDLANTRDGGTHGPAVADVPFLRPVWSVKSTDGDFTGTPVESGGTVVAVSGGGTVLAIDASTGKVRWTRDVTSSDSELVNGTAAIDGGRVFVPISRASGPELAALSLTDGSPLWKVSYDPQTGADTYGSPTVWDGKVFIGTSGQNGDPDVPLRGSVTALAVATGAKVWQTRLVPAGRNGAPVWSTPAIDTATGTMYVGTGNAYSGTAADTTDSVVALDAKTGAVLRHFQATAGDVFTTTSGGAAGPDYDFGASPQLMTGPSGQKLVGEGQKSGTYWALDRATLAPVWSFMTGPGSALGGIIGSTAYDGKHVYGPDTPGGEQWALSLDGTPAWVSADGGPLHWSATAVANGVVYTTDMSSVLTARDAATGAVLIKLPLGAPSYGGVSIAGGYVFAVTGTQGASGYVVGYRADSGGGRRN